MGDLNDNFREKIREVFEGTKLRIAECLGEAQGQGEVSADLDAAEASDFILSSFQGVLVQMKVSKNDKPWEVFDRMIFSRILKPSL